MTAELDEKVWSENHQERHMGRQTAWHWRPLARLRTQEGQPQQDHPRDQGDCPPIRPWGAQGAGQDATQGESEAARVAACREILDRAYGKAMQPIQGTVDYGISEQLAELFRGNAGNTLGAEIARCAALPPPKPH
jgi:hypothetical protein